MSAEVVVGLISSKLLAPIVKLLIERWIPNEGAAIVANGMVGIGQGWFSKKLGSWVSNKLGSEAAMYKIAEGIVSNLGDQYAEQLAEMDYEKIINAVIHTFGQDADGIKSERVVKEHKLNASKLAEAMRETNGRIRGWGDYDRQEQQLVDSMIDTCSKLVVAISEKMPGFHTNVAQETFNQLSSLSDDSGTILKKVTDIHEAVVKRGGKDFEANLRTATVNRHDYMELFGTDMDAEYNRYPLSVAYVSLSLTPVCSHVENDEQEESAPAEFSFEHLLDHVSNNSRRLFIRGEAGSGKSTLCRWAAIKAAMLDDEEKRYESFEQKWSDRNLTFLPGPTESIVEIARELDGEIDGELISNWRYCFPVIIKLRDYQQGELPNLTGEEFLATYAKHLGTVPDGWVEEQMKEGKILLMIDGLDEIPKSGRQQLIQDIGELLETYPKIFCIVTTRPAAAEQGWLAGLEFEESEINDMQRIDQDEFVVNWHKAVKKQFEITKRNPEIDLMELAGQLVERLSNNPRMALLATNPLLCGMICALHRAKQNMLPKSQYDLCEKLCEILLQRGKFAGLENDEIESDYFGLEYREKKLIIQEIAHYMVRNNLSKISTELTDNSVKVAYGRLNKNQKLASVENLREEFVVRSGLLREKEEGQIDFIHNTLKEFLAGQRFATNKDAGSLVSKVTEPEPAWQPTILFSCATDDPDFATDLVTQLIAKCQLDKLKDKDQQISNEDRIRVLFAVKCGAYAVNLDQNVRAELDQFAQTYGRPSDMSEAKDIALLDDFAIEFLKHQENLNANIAAASVRALKHIGSEEAQEAIQEYAKQEDGVTVWKELKTEIEYLDQLNPNITKLDLSDLPIKTLPDSIGDLTALDKLDLANCLELTSLPDSLGRLTTLTSLLLTNCFALTRLPNSIGALKSLKYLDLANCTALTSLPESFGQLNSMANLSLDFCTALAVLPNTFGELNSLTELYFQECNSITTLPESLGKMSSLSVLSLYNCQSLTALPESLGDLASLTSLTLYDCDSLNELPESLGKLTSLEELGLSGCGSLTSLPDSLGSLTSLNYLSLNECTSLTRLPDSFGQLTSLAALNLIRCSSLFSLEPLTKLPANCTLALKGCGGQDTLPEHLRKQLVD